LQEARLYSQQPVEQCVEALGILFSALSSDEPGYRAMQLGRLADQALRVLLEKTPDVTQDSDPKNATDVLVQAWKALANGRSGPEMALISFR
jgi:hypothetical protein